MLATAKLNGLDPSAWLRATLEALPTGLNSQIDSLLPLRAEPLHQVSSQAYVGALNAYEVRVEIAERHNEWQLLRFENSGRMTAPDSRNGRYGHDAAR
ncbi:MAG: transposase domain-containing protein [Pseudomonadota bacterium]